MHKHITDCDCSLTALQRIQISDYLDAMQTAALKGDIVKAETIGRMIWGIAEEVWQ